MSSKKIKGKPKKRLIRITVEKKKEIVDKYEGGKRVSEIAAAYRMPRTTISTIIRNKEIIKAANVAKGVKSISKQRTETLEHMEKLLLVWVKEKQSCGDLITEKIICDKAKQIHSDLLSVHKSQQENEVFKASHGWFDNFKRRAGIRNVVRNVEAVNADEEAANDFVTEFGEFVRNEGLTPKQVFNCGETRMFWKKMPKSTYIAQEEKAMPGRKPMKDRLNILLCCNSTGDCKIKPLLIYHSENPRAFRAENIQKTLLRVMWRSNKRGHVTCDEFVKWFNGVFGPTVMRYLEEKNLPMKALLVMDKCIVYPSSLKDEILSEYDFISIKFFPPNTSPLIQPMDQQVVCTFKKLYTKALFQMCFDETSANKVTLKEFWKNQFNMVQCIGLIEKAWKEISSTTINSAWSSLWPEGVTSWYFEDLSIVEDIVSLGKSMGLEITDNDVEELMIGHTEELTLQDLRNMEDEHERDAGSSDSEQKEPASWLIRKICTKWRDVKTFAELYHPNKEGINQSSQIWEDKVMVYFKSILEKRLEKMTEKDGEKEAGPSGEKKRRKKSGDFFMFRKITKDASTSTTVEETAEEQSERGNSSAAVATQV